MTLTVRLPETIDSQLTTFCEAMGLSKSQVVQGALRDWFAKPATTVAHPLLAYAQTAAASAPSADWAGPYSKQRLRARVLSRVSPLVACESVAEFGVAKVKVIAPRKAAKPRATKSATKPTTQVSPVTGTDAV